MSEELNFNLFNIIVISATIQGLVFSIVVLASKKYRFKSNIFLALAILFLSLNNLYYWFIDTRLSQDIPWYKYLFIPWNLLVLPMYYFFIVNYLQLRLKSRERFYLLMPFIVSLIFHIVLLATQLFWKDKVIISESLFNLFNYSEEYIAIVFTFFVIIMSFLLINRYERNNFEYKRTKVIVNTKWLKEILFLGLIISVIWLGLIFVNQYYQISFFSNYGKYFLWLSLSLIIYWVGYLGVYHVGIFNQRQQIRRQRQKSIIKVHNDSNYSKYDEINALIEDRELFLNANLSLESLANDLNLSTGYLSQLINEFSGTNFSGYINQKRVAKAIEMLLKDEYSNYTIHAIGLESGFNSKSTFYEAFRKETNMTPHEYKNKNLS